ncbi:MAG: alpha-amylase family glycosyl hydrolase [Culicoidibacterales bacterium]
MIEQQITKHLKNIYGKQYQQSMTSKLGEIIKKWEQFKLAKVEPLTEKNIFLITYGDSIYQKNEVPFRTLHHFVKQQVGQAITDIHILPMFPYSSDDGFAVTDYRAINPQLGTWEDLKSMAKDYRLMYDCVANHMSKSSPWFQAFLADEAPYDQFFIKKNEAFDDKNVIRPRVSPLFHDYQGKNEKKAVWTTFSEDQVDLNVHNIDVLVELTDILLFYAAKGASSIRLDAIGFLWKKSGTTSIHLPQTHEIIKLWRTIIAKLAPNTQIITETNVPHEENIQYLGDGSDEASLVYQFTLPPLILHTIQSQDTTMLKQWSSTIKAPSDTASYFNFLASHDGVGVRPVEGILSQAQISELVDAVTLNGGKISYKSNSDGTQTPYELNINYLDALKHSSDVSEQQLVEKAILVHAYLLSFVGVPAIYYHSLFGSSNDYQGLEKSGINRRINRKKLEVNQLMRELKQSNRRKRIFTTLKNLCLIRQNEPAFNPFSPQEIVKSSGNQSIILIRGKKEEIVTTLYNFTSQTIIVTLPFTNQTYHNLITNEYVENEIVLPPYNFAWLKREIRGK